MKDSRPGRAVPLGLFPEIGSRLAGHVECSSARFGIQRLQLLILLFAHGVHGPPRRQLCKPVESSEVLTSEMRYENLALIPNRERRVDILGDVRINCKLWTMMMI